MRTLDARWTAALAVAMMTTALVGTLHADKVTTARGQTFSGAIVSENASGTTIRTEAGTFTIRKADIRDVVREDTTPDEVDGDVAFAGGKYASAQQSYQAAVARLAPTSPAIARLKSKIQQVGALQRRTTESAVEQQMNQVRQLLAQRQYDAALQMMESLQPALTSDEQTSTVKRLRAETHFAKAQLARDSVNLIEMERQLVEAINAYEPFYKAHLAYGEIQLRSAATEAKGIESILRGLRYGEAEMSEEERVKYHYILGKRYFAKQNFEEAAAHFIEAMRTNSTNPAYKDAQDLAVQAYIEMGERNSTTDFQKTIDSLNGALRLNPKNADAHFLLGQIYRDTGETSKAIETLLKVVELDPTHKTAHYYLGLAYLDKFDYDNALTHLDDELKNDPTNYDALVDRAEVQISLATYDKADADLEMAIRLEDSKWRAYLVRGLLAFAREQYDQAQQNLMKVLSIKPDAVEAHIQMGKVLQVQKKYDEARAWFSNVVQYLERAPGLSFRFRTFMAEAQTALGEIDLSQESPRQAETRFKQALEFLKNFPPALNKIGDVRRRLGADAPDGPMKRQLFKEAESFYQQAIAQNPRNAEFYLSLGILYHKNLKDTDKAITNYRKYLELGGRDTVNVNKWIDEAGGGVISDEATTSTANALSTTGTRSASSTTTTLAAGETSGTVAAVPKTTGSLSATPATTATAVGLPTPAPVTTQTTQTAAGTAVTTASGTK